MARGVEGGEIMLESGSGSGRVTCKTSRNGAMVISTDYSDAVKANFQSNGNPENTPISSSEHI